MSRIQNTDVSVNEVYDIAFDIAQEFENFVRCYSLDSIKPLVDKVINALEILEYAIKRNEQLQAEIEDLKSNNLHLSSEKIVSDHEKRKLKQIFEENEDSWLHEVGCLKTQLSAAKSEIELLKSHLSIKSDSCSVTDDGLKSVIENHERIAVRYQRALKQKEMQLVDHVSNINALNSRIQELLEANKLLHIKNQQAQNDISKLSTEKNIYKSELILQKKETMLLNESFDELVHSNLQKPKSCNRCLPQDYDEDSHEESLEKNSSYHLRKEKKLLEKIKKLQAELHSARLKSQQYEENASRLNSDDNTFSKIHQFFHLFLGLTTISELCWF